MGRGHVRRPSPGQGAVEYIGVVLVVAATMMVASLAIARLVPAPTSGGALAQIVTTARAEAFARVLGVAEPSRPSRLRRIARAAATVGRAIVRGQIAMRAAFVRALIDDAQGLRRDPLALFHVGADADVFRAVAGDPARFVAERLAAVRRYVALLRALGPEDAYVRLMSDGGTIAEDLLVSRGRQTLLRRVATGRWSRRSRSGTDTKK